MPSAPLLPMSGARQSVCVPDIFDRSQAGMEGGQIALVLDNHRNHPSAARIILSLVCRNQALTALVLCKQRAVQSPLPIHAKPPRAQRARRYKTEYGVHPAHTCQIRLLTAQVTSRPSGASHQGNQDRPCLAQSTGTDTQRRVGAPKQQQPQSSRCQHCQESNLKLWILAPDTTNTTLPPPPYPQSSNTLLAYSLSPITTIKDKAKPSQAVHSLSIFCLLVYSVLFLFTCRCHVMSSPDPSPPEPLPPQLLTVCWVHGHSTSYLAVPCISL
ncbi:hypothetical protein QBC39DRAFT_98903 [Podospora conica]|nr:hypothetical protein QBC39DRAFT_98903 [Schizothecium conicum]